MQKLAALNTLLSQANYKAFWATLDSDDLYADLIADVSGFEELMRIRIAVTVGQTCREVDRRVLEGWLALQGPDFERFITDICGWALAESAVVKGGVVVIPVNKENEAKGTVVRENVQFDREFLPVFSFIFFSSFLFFSFSLSFFFFFFFSFIAVFFHSLLPIISSYSFPPFLTSLLLTPPLTTISAQTQVTNFVTSPSPSFPLLHYFLTPPPPSPQLDAQTRKVTNFFGFPLPVSRIRTHYKTSL